MPVGSCPRWVRAVAGPPAQTAWISGPSSARWGNSPAQPPVWEPGAALEAPRYLQQSPPPAHSAPALWLLSADPVTTPVPVPRPVNAHLFPVRPGQRPGDQPSSCTRDGALVIGRG